MYPAKIQRRHNKSAYSTGQISAFNADLEGISRCPIDVTIAMCERPDSIDDFCPTGFQVMQMDITNIGARALAEQHGLWITKLSQIGRSLTYERPARVFTTKCVGSVSIGFMSYLGGGLIKNTTIGRFVCSANAMIGAPAHPIDWLSVHPFQYNGGPFGDNIDAAVWRVDKRFEGNNKQTIIGNDVWIGENVVILQGVQIADGAVVAANAVVTKDVGPYEVVAGVPAKKIKVRFRDDLVERLLSLRWWQYLLPASLSLPYEDVEASLEKLEQARDSGKLETLQPTKVTIFRSGKSYLADSLSCS